MCIPDELASILDTAQPRRGVQPAVRRWLDGQGRVLVLTGAPGAGKSVLCAGLIRQLRAERHDVLAYFCSSRFQGSSLSPRYFVASLAEQLISLRPDVVSQELAPARGVSLSSQVTAGDVSGAVTGISVNQLVIQPESVTDLFSRLVAEPLRRLAKEPRSGRVVLVVDGLDEALAHSGVTVIDVLCENVGSLPAGCKVLLSSQNRSDVVHRLRDLDGNHVEIDLSSPESLALARADIQEWAVRTLATGGGFPGDHVQAGADIARTSAGSFLHADALVTELGQDPSYAVGRTPRQIKHYYWDLLRRIEAGYERSGHGDWNRVRRLLDVLAVARAPLSVRDLGAFTDLTIAEVAAVLVELGPLLTFLGTGPGGEEGDGPMVILANTSVVDFLHSGAVGESTPNEFASDPVEIEFSLLDKVVHDGLEPEWSRTPYVMTYLGAHLLHLHAERADLATRLAADLDWERVCALQAALGNLLPAPEEAATSSIAVFALLYAPTSGSWQRIADLFTRSSSPYFRSSVVDALGAAGIADDVMGELIVTLLRAGRPPAWSSGGELLLRAPVVVREAVVRRIAVGPDDDTSVQLAYALGFLLARDPAAVSATWLAPVLAQVALWRPRVSRRALRFMAHASISAYICNCERRDVAVATSELWERTFKEKLHLHRLNRPWIAAALSFAAGEALARQVVSDNIVTAEFRRRGRTTGPDQVFERLLRHLDPQLPLEPVAADLAAAFESGSTIRKLLAAQVLAVRSTVAPDDGAAFVEGAFPAASAAARSWMISAFALILPTTPPAWEPLLRRATAAFVERDHGLADQPVVDLWPIAIGLACAKGTGTASLLEWVLTLDAGARGALLDGLAAAGIFYPDAVLAAVRDQYGRTTGRDLRRELQDALLRIRVVHTRAADLVLNEIGRPEFTVDADSRYYLRARRLVDILGLYNNGVHQALEYPRMRSGILCPTYELLHFSPSEKVFVRQYASRILDMLRRADYRLMNWTVP